MGIESTVIDLTTTPPRILRPGMIHVESLAAVVEAVQSPKFGVQPPESALRSPGLLPKHYAPRARLVVLGWRNEPDLENQIRRAGLGVPRSKIHVVAHTCIPSATEFGWVSVIPHDAEAFARALYAELHRCDEAGAEVILMESPPDEPAWAAIADRLTRAASQIEAGG